MEVGPLLLTPGETGGDGEDENGCSRVRLGDLGFCGVDFLGISGASVGCHSVSVTEGEAP